MTAGPGIDDPAGLPTTCWVSPHLTCSAIFVKVHRRDPVGAGDGSAWIPRLLTRQINVAARHRQLDKPTRVLLGEGIQPWVEVYNTGNVALTNVKLTAGQGTANCTAATLAPGANVVCKNNAIPRHTIITADMLAALPLVEGRSPCRRRLPAGGHCGKVPQDFFAHLFYFDPISGKLSTWNSNEARADERSPPPSSMLSSISSATPLPMIRSHQETSWR